MFGYFGKVYHSFKLVMKANYALFSLSGSGKGTQKHTWEVVLKWSQQYGKIRFLPLCKKCPLLSGADLKKIQKAFLKFSMYDLAEYTYVACTFLLELSRQKDYIQLQSQVDKVKNLKGVQIFPAKRLLLVTLPFTPSTKLFPLWQQLLLKVMFFNIQSLMAI